MRAALCVLSALILLAAGCGREVRVVSPDTDVHLSGRWNDADSKAASSMLIDKALKDPWITNFRDRTGRKPVVRVSQIRNSSNEEIDTGVFTDDLANAFVTSQKVRVVGSRAEAELQRAERADVQANSSAATRPQSGQEQAPDFLLQGSIKIQHDQHGGQQVKFYQVDLKLIDLVTNEMVWQGPVERKKIISQ